MTVTRTTKGYIVKLAPLAGDPSGPTPIAEYAAYDAADILRPISVNEKISPNTWTGRVELNLTTPTEAALKHYPWEWRSMLAIDDRIMIIENVAEEDVGDAKILFEGFVTDVDWSMGNANSSAIVTAVSYAHRLLRDQEYCVYGRWMPDRVGLAAGQAAVAAVFYNGLRCEFNAGGAPNMYKDRWQDIDTATYVNAGPKGGVPLFTYDGDPAAEFWTWGDIWDYLIYRYNAFEKWFTDVYDTAPSDYTEPAAHIACVEGMGLWQALGSAGDRFGYDVFEELVNDGAGNGEHHICSTKQHSGHHVTVKHQGLLADGDGVMQRQMMDLTATNMTACSISENATSANTAPIVAGGAKLYEITIPLLPAWDPANLTTPVPGIATNRIIVPWGGTTFPNPNNLYFTQYCKQGSIFMAYASVGRLWDANTDGRYSDAPYSQATQTIGKAGDTINIGDTFHWPIMPHAALPTITQIGGDADKRASAGYFVEASVDNGVTWFHLPNCRLVPGRLAVYIEEDNLAAIREPSDTNAFGGADFFTKLVAGTVKLQLTCTVAGPARNMLLGAKRGTAGTAFKSCEYVDRGSMGQIRTRHASSSLIAHAALGADTYDGTSRLTDVMAIVQGVQEDRYIEANLPIEWPDEELYLTDCVTKIAGIEYSLATCAGATLKYPRIVSIMRMLTDRDWTMVIGLSTDRKMPFGLQEMK